MADKLGPQAPGVGKNSKRHDLERQATPGLADSDLQQGDVAALEEGQRIAPVDKQSAAQAAPGGGVRSTPTAAPQPSNLDDVQGVVSNRLKGTLGQGAPLGVPDEELRRRGAGWANILQQLAKQPGASPLFRAQIQDQIARQANDQAHGPRGGFFNLSLVDDAIQGLNDGQI